MKKNSLSKNIIYNIGYQILAMIVPLITSPYISRVLGADGIGEYAYTYSIVHYFALFAMLGVLNYGNREIAKVKENPRKIANTFWGIYSVQFLAGITSVVAFVVYYTCFCDTYKETVLVQVLYLIGTVFDISWFLFGMEQFQLTTAVSALNKLLTTICIFLFVKQENDIGIYTILLAGGFFLNQLIYWVYSRKYIHVVRINWSEVRSHIFPIIRLFLPVIAVSIYKYMDKIMLGSLINAGEVGIYEAAEKFVNLPLSIITAIGTVMLPRITNMKTRNETGGVKKYTYASMTLVMYLSFGIVLGLTGISDVLIPWFYGEEFVASTNVLLTLLPSVLFVSWANVVRMQCLLPNQRDKEYCISVFAGAVINFVLNLITIPMYGAVGAAISTTITECAVCIIQSIATRKEMEFGRYAKSCVPFAFSAMLMCGVILQIDFTNELCTIVIRIIAGVVIYFMCASFFLIKQFRNCKAVDDMAIEEGTND